MTNPIVTMKRLSHYCSLEEFTINGIEADYEDFGYTFDARPEDAPVYGCGSREFEAHQTVPSAEILAKYLITEQDVDSICDALREELYMGQCGLCC